MRPLWLQLGVTTDVGSYGSRIGARLSGTTRGQIRFSDNGDHIESAYEIRVYVHAILFCPESRSREAIPSKIELICPTTRANHLLLVGRAQAVAIATSKGVERMLSRSLPASQNGPIRTSLVPLSRPIYWPSLPADNGSEEFAVVTVESISLHSIEMVGRAS
jgi:hypothetical protein